MPDWKPLELALQRLFDWQSNADLDAALGQCKSLIQQWSEVEHAPLHHSHSIPALSQQIFAQSQLPEEGQDWHTLWPQLQKDLIDHTWQLNHPRYIGHMTQAQPWCSVLTELLIGLLNQNLVKYETAWSASLIERQVLRWLHREIYPQTQPLSSEQSFDGLGNMVSGGTMGNLTALAVALETLLPGSRQQGLWQAMKTHDYQGLAILGSTRMHYSLQKAAATLGIGADSVYTLPVDDQQRVDLTALSQTIAQLQQQRIARFLIKKSAH